jgi:hypothetical protein
LPSLAGAVMKGVGFTRLGQGDLASGFLSALDNPQRLSGSDHLPFRDKHPIGACTGPHAHDNHPADRLETRKRVYGRAF